MDIVLFIITAILVAGIIFLLLVNHRKSKELKALQNAVQDNSNTALSNNVFFTNLSHELKTPLNVINGMSDLVLNLSNNEDITNYTRSIKVAGDMLNFRINNLLNFSKFESTKLTSNIEFFSFRETMYDYINYVILNCREKGFNFKFIGKSELPLILGCDKSLLMQVLYIMIMIALKYGNPDTTIMFSFYVDNITETDEKLIADSKTSVNMNLNVDITSTDSSIYGELIDEIFPEHTLGNVENCVSADTRISLIMLKHIFDFLGGFISVKNIENNGVRCHTSIPVTGSKNTFELYQVIKNVEQSLKTSENDFTFIAPEAKILSVDDSSINNNIIHLLLKDTLINVDTSINPENALTKIKSSHYDIVLIDYLMPKMNGIELLHEIKNSNINDLNKTKFIICSANLTDENSQEYLKAGFNDYLPKPIDKTTILRTIKSNLSEQLLDTNSDNIQTEEDPNYDLYVNKLNNYNIVLDDALKYMNGSIQQYSFVASLMIKEYNHTREEIDKAYAENDLSTLHLKVHSIKGNAKYLGANFLYYTAFALEQKCKYLDKSYVDNSIGLFNYLYDNMICGLKEFQSLYNVSDDGERNDRIEELFSAVNNTNYKDYLLEYIDNYEAEPAIQLCKYILKSIMLSDYEYECIKKSISYLEELEFEDALELINNL